MISILFISFAKYELQMRKKFRHFFHNFHKFEKKLTSFLTSKVAFDMLVQFTKPWTLYLVSGMRYRGSKMKNSQNYRFYFKILFEKTQEAELIFLKIGFNENVAEDPVQLSAKTWCPYLLWVLRNLPHRFESWHMSRNLRKKNVTIWQNSSPKN